VEGRIPSLLEPKLLAGQLHWLEQRPDQQGRTTLMRRPFGVENGGAAAPPPAEELTPGGWNLRSRIHGYGGGAYALELVEGQAIAVVVDDRDRCLWRLDLGLAGAAPNDPIQLTRPAPRAFGGGLIDARRQRWIGVMEADGRDQLVAVSLQGGEPVTLHQAADFCGDPTLSPRGSHLAWVEWQQPCLPWERSQLWLGCFAAAGADGTGQGLGEGLKACRPVAGSDNTSRQAISVFQPLWTGAPGALPADLLVACDRSSWWNLERLVAAEALTAADLVQPLGEVFAPPPAWQPLLPMEAEFATPQWVLGLSTTAWDGSQLLATACFEGSWQLGRIRWPSAPALAPSPQPASWIPFDLPFSEFGGLCSENGALACLASGATSPSGLLELELAGGQWRHSPAAASPLAAEAISKPKPLWFAGYGGAPTHAWYYPPIGGATPESPLLVKGHSGPTAMARCGLNLAIQFWTSRGWGVLDVNYGGSTGFGRAYRQRLDRHWGLVDSADCAAAALAVVAAGNASAQRLAIEGGSAGGFTVLSALCFSDVFRAGACRYAVSDLEGLVADGHRFEAHYLDSLVGPWPEQRATYRGRSPLHHADRISAPVIFFQGLDDQVVPPSQTDSMAEVLRRRGVPVEVHHFAGEGHGFRSGAVRVAVLEATEAFFRHHFALGCA
jgi:dienelactone hydrolase